ncbi:MAG: YfiR family protein, partial [Bacteroidales bacterium]|nr:YfiR family protein [Bacteroidales bacterium]
LGQTAYEYEIKSAYLEKISRFIYWPGTIDSSRYFIIGIAGNNPFKTIIYNDYQTRFIKNKPVKIKEVTNKKDIQGCHLLFIPKDIENDLESYIQASQLYHTLIISEKDGWAEQGIHINFYIRDDKVRFEINVESLKKSGLKAESMLLDYARIVKTKTN